MNLNTVMQIQVSEAILKKDNFLKNIKENIEQFIYFAFIKNPHIIGINITLMLDNFGRICPPVIEAEIMRKNEHYDFYESIEINKKNRVTENSILKPLRQYMNNLYKSDHISEDIISNSFKLTEYSAYVFHFTTNDLNNVNIQQNSTNCVMKEQDEYIKLQDCICQNLYYRIESLFLSSSVEELIFKKNKEQYIIMNNELNEEKKIIEIELKHCLDLFFGVIHTKSDKIHLSKDRDFGLGTYYKDFNNSLLLPNRIYMNSEKMKELTVLAEKLNLSKKILKEEYSEIKIQESAKKRI